jgi:type I restriction enzyme, R subunit
MNETETRAELIDPALTLAGWGVVEGSKIRRAFPISKGRLIGHGQRTKPLEADYVLQYRNRNIGIIEAKKRDFHYTEGVAQAKNYAGLLQVRFTFSTNGLRIYEIDMEEAKERDIKTFPSPDELWTMCFPEQPNGIINSLEIITKEKLFSIPFETKSQLKPPRYYQENAINNVSNAIAEGGKRILLTLATGTGKTAVAFQIAWRLFQAKWNMNGDFKRSPRILFLADRNILADQAYSNFNEYNAFEENALVRIYPGALPTKEQQDQMGKGTFHSLKKNGKVPKNGNIFFAIFQTFMSGADDKTYFGEYEKDFFDFIIIDECHRGGANDESSWRDIMEYFSPAVQLGLTATPKRKLNKDTYKYFGDPVYVYSLKQGINDGFLTPFKVKQIATTGDDYIYTSDDEIIEGEIEQGKVYDIDEQNKVIELMDIEAFRVRTFMEMIDQNQKTLVFCATQAHALAVRNLINQMAISKNPNYCHRVTADDGKLGEQHLRDFQDNEKSIPTILTTSQKLSTGVDAPEIRNIVLLRPVKQLIEFKQIVGRGTRLFDGKDYFTIYDFVKAYKNFSDPDWDGEPEDPEPPIERPMPPPKPCATCGQRPCICLKEPEPPCLVCQKSPCECPSRQMIRVKLSDGKVRDLQKMVSTSFWNPDGKPISAEEFLENLFGELPAFFKNEEELIEIWRKPDTRKKLLDELKEKGFAKEQLEEFQRVLNAQNSDLYDVLAYVAFHSTIIERTIRAERAKIYLHNYDAKQQDFLNFVLKQYINSGVYELDEEKLSPLLVLKYNAINDAKKALGDIASIRKTFIGFQGYLYGGVAG